MRACMRACVCACVRARLRVCVRMYLRVQESSGVASADLGCRYKGDPVDVIRDVDTYHKSKKYYQFNINIFHKNIMNISIQQKITIYLEKSHCHTNLLCTLKNHI